MLPQYFTEALKLEGIDGPLAELATSIFAQESNYGRHPGINKKNAHGVLGPMQVKDSTFASVADKGWNHADPLHNTRAGLRYIKKMHERAGGDLSLTATGYYGGPGAINKARRGVGVGDKLNPNAPTTLGYADQVMARMGGNAPTTAPATAVADSSARAGTAPLVPRQGGASDMGALTDAGDSVVAQAQTAATAPATPYNLDPVAPVNPEWEALRRGMPQGNPTASLASYGQIRSPNFQAVVAAPREVDFSRFSSMLGRA